MQRAAACTLTQAASAQKGKQKDKAGAELGGQASPKFLPDCWADSASASAVRRPTQSTSAVLPRD
eukprot:364595-Chlamydomonas_euryale.AAC.6